MISSPTPRLSGDIYVSRAEDGELVGRMAIRHACDSRMIMIAVRHHGALGHEEERRFADLDEASAWIAASPNKPLTSDDNPGIRRSGGTGPARILIQEMPDGRFIGINPEGKTGPAVYPGNPDSSFKSGTNYIKRTKTAWSVFVDDRHHATRKCVKEALLCFADALQPQNMSGHEKLAWKTDVIDKLKQKLEADPLPFDPEVIPVETSGYKNR